MIKYCNICKNYYCRNCFVNPNKHSHKQFIGINEERKKCKKHLEEFRYFCLDCQAHFCKDDKTKYHDGHDIKDLSQLNDEFKNNQIKPLRQTIMKKKSSIGKNNNIK